MNLYIIQERRCLTILAYIDIELEFWSCSQAHLLKRKNWSPISAITIQSLGKLNTYFSKEQLQQISIATRAGIEVFFNIYYRKNASVFEFDLSISNLCQVILLPNFKYQSLMKPLDRSMLRK